MTTQILDNAERPIHDKPWEHLSALVQAAESDPIAEFITALSHEERVRAVLNLDTDRRGELMNFLPSDLAADLVEDTPHEAAVDMIERLAPAKAAEIVGELETDVRADLVGEMEAAEAEAILAELDSETAEDIRQLAAYDDDEAGGLMTSDVFQFAASATVGSVLRKLASDDEDLERYSGQHPYIVDPAGRLVGVASPRGLLTAKRSQLLSEIMADVIGVNVHTKLDQLDEFFDAHDFLGAPVVNDDGILVGVVSRSAFADAQIERVEQESVRAGYAQGDVSAEEVSPAVHVDEAISCGEIAARPPLLLERRPGRSHINPDFTRSRRRDGRPRSCGNSCCSRPATQGRASRSRWRRRGAC